MRKFGCPETFIFIVLYYHDGMKAEITGSGGISHSFFETNVVKLNSVPKTTLFSMMFSAMLTDAFWNTYVGVPRDLDAMKNCQI